MDASGDRRVRPNSVHSLTVSLAPSISLGEIKLPISIYESTEIGQMVSTAGEQFCIRLGLSKDLVSQLRTLSRDESDIALQQYTGDSARFGAGLYEEWYGKGRTPFALVHVGSGALAGLVWFGPKSLGKKSIRFGLDEPQSNP